MKLVPRRTVCTCSLLWRPPLLYALPPAVIHFLGAGLMAVAHFLAPAGSARADIIFSDFAAGNSYNASDGYLIGNDFNSDNLADANSFTVGAGTSYTLHSITIALGDVADAGNTATVELMSDSGGLPGSVIRSFNTGALPNFGASNNSPITLTDANTDVLQASTTYWIAVVTSSANDIEWNFNSTSASGTIAQSLNGGSTWSSQANQTLGAFSIDATSQSVVPEPSTFVLFGIGVLGIGVWRARHGKRASCWNGDVESTL